MVRQKYWEDANKNKGGVAIFISEKEEFSFAGVAQWLIKRPHGIGAGAMGACLGCALIPCGGMQDAADR